MADKQFDNLQKMLCYRFKDSSLLKRALSHRSVGEEHNERLEFLGDAVLDMVITTELYRRFAADDEGTLTRLRARLVKKEALATIAKELNIGEHLFLGPGEVKSGARDRDSTLSDALEAVIGAIYLDGGLLSVEKAVLSWYVNRLLMISENHRLKDPKTRLQEFLQAKGLPTPEYTVVNVTGKSGKQKFHVECHAKGYEQFTKSDAFSRQKAEQAAALELLKLITDE